MDYTKRMPPKPFSENPSVGMVPAKPISAQAPSGSGSLHQPLAGGERRRSQRVMLRVQAKIHVAVQGSPTTYDVFTFSVNACGALVAMKQNLPTGTRLILEHSGTKERMACSVVRSPRDTAEGFHTAIEFDSAAPDFWRIAFPPANWRPEDS
jgi:hypothetical protein